MGKLLELFVRHAFAFSLCLLDQVLDKGVDLERCWLENSF